MAGNSDDTVILPRKGQRRSRPRSWLRTVLWLIVISASAAAISVAALKLNPQPPRDQPAAIAISTADEAEIAADVPERLVAFRFAPNPAILVLDFPTLGEQARMLNRIAVLVEARGAPHDRVLTNAELTAFIGSVGATPDTFYFGHDYRAADLARFFALADSAGTPLDGDERHLRAIIAEAQAESGGFGALITLPRVSESNQIDEASRTVILHHELSHGEYFTNPAYARFVAEVWRNVLNDDERARVRSYLSADGYDPALEDLMMNEMQAYLMYTAGTRFFDAARLGIPPTRLAEIRERFAAGLTPGWLRVIPPTPRRKLRQRCSRVSRTTTPAATLPPRRRRSSIAA